MVHLLRRVRFSSSGARPFRFWFRVRGSARETVFALVPTGNPSSLRFGHPDVTTGDTVLPRWDTSRVPHISSAPSPTWDMSREAPAPFLRSYRGTRPRFASDTLMSLQEGTAPPATICRQPRGRRYSPSLLQGGGVPHISSAPSSVWDMGTEALVLFLRSYREPVLASLRTP